ncbi:hypothetical protein Tco_1315169 [Tanacetum coccineum]
MRRSKASRDRDADGCELVEEIGAGGGNHSEEVLRRMRGDVMRSTLSFLQFNRRGDGDDRFDVITKVTEEWAGLSLKG